MDGVARRQAMMDLFKMYVWISVMIFVCIMLIFLVSPESFHIG